MDATRLSDRVLVVTGDYFQEHMTAIDTGDGLVVIDTLATVAATRAALAHVRAFSRAPVRLLVNTHLDVDHVAGNHLFDGATIIAHANGRRHLDEHVFDDPASEREIRDFVAGLEAAAAGGSPDERLPAYVAGYRTLLGGFGNYVFRPPTVFVAGGSTVALGTTVVELHHAGPAHTDADLVVWIPAERLLLAGDVVVGEGFAPVAHAMHGGSVSGLAAAVRQLQRLAGGDARIVPGHGAVGGVALLQHQLGYLDALIGSVREARGQGLSLDEARGTVQVDAFSTCLLYDLVHPGHVELAWKEIGEVSGRASAGPDAAAGSPTR